MDTQGHILQNDDFEYVINLLKRKLCLIAIEIRLCVYVTWLCCATLFFLISIILFGINTGNYGNYGKTGNVGQE